MEECRWQLLETLQTNDMKIAVLLLNQPVTKDCKVFNQLWKKGCLRVCVDGSANHLYEMLAGNTDFSPPHMVTGDFDSIQSELLQYYKDRGVEVIPTPDQDETDFTKCVRLVIEKHASANFDCIVAYGAFGGRVDHMFANVNSLFTARQLAPTLPLYLMDSSNIACLLLKGRHVLHVDTGLEGTSVGLIPIDGACKSVTTAGLKWNLHNESMRFGELVSTSNTWNGEPVVTIETDNPILWTMDIKADG